MIRGSAVPVICPKRLLVIVVLGLLNSAWLRTLKASARNSSLTLSLKMGVVLASARSKFVRPGPRNAFRGRLPKVRSAALAIACAELGNPPGHAADNEQFEKFAGL